MQRANFSKIVLLSLVFIVLLSQDILAHPLGLTFTNIRYTKETLTLSTRIFYGDFCAEFNDYTKKKNKNYVMTGIDMNDKKDFINYFKKNLRLWVNNSEIHFKTIKINFERHSEDAYILLVELDYNNINIRTGAKIKIKDTILLKTIGGQKHLINFYLKDPNTLSHGIITLDKNSPQYEFVNN